MDADKNGKVSLRELYEGASKFQKKEFNDVEKKEAERQHRIADTDQDGEVTLDGKNNILCCPSGCVVTTTKGING